MFSFQQGLSRETVRLIADSCLQLKKLILRTVEELSDEDVLHVINKLGKQLTTLVLDGDGLTDAGYSYLKNCPR
jgi:EAL domain-containing protein (putative c-di-GMP-specific phosphodiesterase class I)